MSLSIPQIAALVVAILAVGAAAIVWRRRSRDPVFRLDKACRELLQDFLIPDGNEGEIHIEFAGLTSRGIVLIDTRQDTGHVFGSSGMQEWTVIDGKQRYTFANPLGGLLDRIAAVRGISPNVPVTGYVAFPERANFSKGRPEHAVHFESLIAELEAEAASVASGAIDAFYPEWERLRESAGRAGSVDV